MKITSRNSLFLAGTKRRMNSKIYKRVAALMNSGSAPLCGGIEQSRVYLQQFFNRPITVQEVQTWAAEGK